MCIVLGVFELSNQYFVLFSKMCVHLKKDFSRDVYGNTSVEKIGSIPNIYLGEPKEFFLKFYILQMKMISKKCRHVMYNLLCSV